MLPHSGEAMTSAGADERQGGQKAEKKTESRKVVYVPVSVPVSVSVTVASSSTYVAGVCSRQQSRDAMVHGVTSLRSTSHSEAKLLRI